jgi:hypothetical protein
MITTPPLVLDVVDPALWLVVPSGFSLEPVPAIAAGRGRALSSSATFSAAVEQRLTSPAGTSVDVVVAAFAGSEFTHGSQLDDYLQAIVEAFAGRRPTVTRIAGLPGAATGTIAAVRDGSIAVIAEGIDAPTVLEALVQAHLASVSAPVPAAPAPLVGFDQNAVYLALGSADFALFPESDPDDVDTFEGPSLPAMPPLSSFPSGRLIGVGPERRGVAYSMLVDPAAVPTVAARTSALLEVGRSFDVGATASEAPSRTVITATRADGPVRMFGVGVVLVVVIGDDPEVLDAIVDEWVRALAASGAPD